jgi:hypothetical protein
LNELKVQIASILKADTTLRSLLSKVADPYGVYFVKPPAGPTFPLVTHKISGGSVGGGSRDGQIRSLALRISAYSKTNTDRIMERIKKILDQATSFSGLTSCKVLFIGIENIGMDDFDREFQTYVRTDQYRVYLVKMPSR